MEIIAFSLWGVVIDSCCLICVVFGFPSLTFSHCCQFFVFCLCLSVRVKPSSLRQRTKQELEKQLDELKTELAQVRGKVCGGEY